MKTTRNNTILRGPVPENQHPSLCRRGLHKVPSNRGQPIFFTSPYLTTSCYKPEKTNSISHNKLPQIQKTASPMESCLLLPSRGNSFFIDETAPRRLSPAPASRRARRTRCAKRLPRSSATCSSAFLSGAPFSHFPSS